MKALKKFAHLLLILLLPLILTGQERQISFKSGSLTLNGTLALPIRTSQPFPLVILVHGSGPQDRNQTITLTGQSSLCLYPGLFNQTIRNFEDISDHLVENGIAVLRYDKRTFTHGQTLDPQQIVVEDYIEDLNAAIEFARQRSEIDADKIFLAGHSQGSTIIPVSAQNYDIAGLISLAGPTTPIDSLLPEQYRHLYEECANDPQTGAFIANQFYDQFNRIRRGLFDLDQQITITFPGNPNPIPQGYGRFWKSWIDLSDDVLQNYQEAGNKALIIQGKDDLNVPFMDAEDFSILSGAEIHLYDGINHFLTTATVNQVSRQILDQISDWILGCLTSTTQNRTNKSWYTVDRLGNMAVVRLDNPTPLTTLTLYSITGQVISNTKCSGTECSLSIPIEGNTYILEIISENRRAIERI